MFRLSIAACLIVIAACASSNVCADEALPAVYQRLSTQATAARANWARDGGNWGGGWGYGNPGFYSPWFAPQAFVGTWYQRPYPDHLIYNNVRSAMPQMPEPAVDCPCLEAPVAEPISP